MESPSNPEVRERITDLLAQSERQTVAEIAKALHLPISVITSNMGFLTRSNQVLKEPGNVKKLPVYRLPSAEDKVGHGRLCTHPEPCPASQIAWARELQRSFLGGLFAARGNSRAVEPFFRPWWSYREI